MNKPFVLIFILFCFLTGCDYYDTRLIIVNNTDHAISIATFSDTIPDYPPLNKPEYYLTHGIPSGKEASQMSFGSQDGWLEKIKFSKNKKLNVFVYTNDTVAKYHAMDIINANKLYHRISLSQQQLEAYKWRLTIDGK